MSPCALQNVLWSAELGKKWKYLQNCQDNRVSFTPICVSVDDLLGKESDFYPPSMRLFMCQKGGAFQHGDGAD